MTLLWTRDEAVALCVAVEALCPPFGCHVALTGGTLYKDGPRKDCDLLFYRIRQAATIDIKGLINRLCDAGLFVNGGWGWCYKFETDTGKSVDAFFPEEQGGPDYRSKDEIAAAEKEAVLV